MPKDGITFVYLDIEIDNRLSAKKTKPSISLEIEYSLATLRAEVDRTASVVVYTNKPSDYSRLPIEVESIEARVPEIVGPLPYIYRAKPWVLLDALRKRGRTCVFLDSDTFILPGFFKAIQERTASSAVLHEVYWGQQSCYRAAIAQPFPSQSRHALSSSPLFSGNSGVVGLRPGVGESILEDTIHIIDEILPTKNWTRVLEQDALAEAIWLHGVPVNDVQSFVRHYWPNSQKRYMHFQIKRLLRQNSGHIRPMRPCIKLNTHRVKLYQYYHDVNTFLSDAKQLARASIRT